MAAEPNRLISTYREGALTMADWRLRTVRRLDALDSLLLLCQAHGLTIPEREVRFHPTRRWRADYLWRTEKVILEIDGGLYRGGRRPGSKTAGHSSAPGILRDMEKGNAAQILGYLYLRLAPWQVADGAIPLLRAAFARGPELGR